MSVQPHRVTVIPGDGVGPEVVRSGVRIVEAAGVRVDDKLTEPVLVALLEGVPVELLLLLPVPDSLALGVGLCVADTDAVYDAELETDDV